MIMTIIKLEIVFIFFFFIFAAVVFYISDRKLEKRIEKELKEKHIKMSSTTKKCGLCGKPIPSHPTHTYELISEDREGTKLVDVCSACDKNLQWYAKSRKQGAKQ